MSWCSSSRREIILKNIQASGVNPKYGNVLMRLRSSWAPDSRGNFESGLRPSYPLKAVNPADKAPHTSKIQDDSIVYRESKSSQEQGNRMKPVQRRGESFNVGKSKARSKEARSPQGPPWQQNQASGGGTQRNYVNCDSYSQGQLQRRQYSERQQHVSNHGLSQHANPALTKSTPTLNEQERKPPDIQGPIKVQHPVLSPSKSSPDIKNEIAKENRYNQRPANLNINNPDKHSFNSQSPRDNSWKMYGDESGRSYLEKPNPSMYTSGDISESKNRKYERRSLPPHLHRYQADYENISALGTTPLQSEKISEIEDESDESPDMPPRSPDIMPGSIPMPPIRDPSTLKFVRYSQVHEKYPSWPVTKANGAGKQAEPITTRAQSWTDHTNTNKELSVKAEITRPPGLRPLNENSPQTERKGEDGTKRIGSDPGFKTQFVYDKYGRVRQKNFDSVNGKHKFEDFLISKPGYPPPMLDSDGHNFGDKEYSVPSPPERDMPGVELAVLSDKLGGSSPSAVPEKVAENVHSNYRVDYVPKDNVRGDSRRKSTHDNSSRDRSKKLDSGTSPMNSPLEEKNPLRPVDKQSESRSRFDSSSILESKQGAQFSDKDTGKPSSQSHPPGKAFIVKQTPYYNTSTQTDVSSYAIKTSVRRTEPRPCNAKIEVNDFGGQTSPISPAEQRKLCEEKSNQARMSWHQQDEKHNSGDKTDHNQGNYFNFNTTRDHPTDKATFEGIESIKAKYATDEDREDKFENASSCIPHYTEYTPSMAPILRKLSEEFYRGRLPTLTDKHLSSASSQDVGHHGGLKEAESYSSVVIHPSESSGPFGRDEFGSRSSLSDSHCDVSSVMSESMGACSRISMPRGRHSLDPSFFSHKIRPLSDSRYSSSSVLSHDRGNSLSASEKETSHKDSETMSHDNRLRSPHKNSETLSHDNRLISPHKDGETSSHDSRLRSPRQSSDSSVPSQPKSSSDTRSSGSTQFSDSPLAQIPSKYPRDTQDDMYNDSVFVVEDKSPVPSDPSGGKSLSDNTGQPLFSASVTRKHSMKKAYGIFDEEEGEQNLYKNSDLSSTQKGLVSSVDYLHMQTNSARSDVTPLGQIQEEAEVESSHRPTSVPSRTETSKMRSEKKLNSGGDWRATRDMWRDEHAAKRGSDEHAAKRGSLKRTTSEQISTVRERSDQNIFNGEDRSLTKGLTGSYKGTGPDPSKISKLDEEKVAMSIGHSYTKSDSSETKKQQQDALLSFFERKTGKKGLTGSCSSQESDQSPTNNNNNISMNQYEHIAPSSPTSSVNEIITKASENLKNSKAKRSDSLRRSGSSSSPRSSADYVDMNRQRKVTEWSQLRSQGSFSYSPGPSNRSSFASEHPYEDISVFSPHTPRNSMSERNVDDNMVANTFESPLSSRPRDLGVGGSMDSGMIVSPTYQNLYPQQRRAPPPPPSDEDMPPALPPRNYRKQSAPALTTINEPGPQVKTDENHVDDTKLEFRSLLSQWETHSPREESQYADQLRKQASRRYSEQHRPNATSMSIIQSRTKINFSTTFKREPMIAQEATEPGNNSNSPDHGLMVAVNKPESAFMENNNNNKNDSSQKLLQNSEVKSSGKRERTLSDMPPPSPPQNVDDVLKSEEELPPPPPEMTEYRGESINKNGEIEKFADDSYGAYVSRSRREVGTYKRSISAATLQSDNNNYKLSTEANSQFSDKPLGKHPWNSESALSQSGSSLHPPRESRVSSRRSSREPIDSSPLNTVRESNDESQLRSSDELNDCPNFTYNRESNDGHHLRSNRELNDGSQLRTSRELNDGSQLRTSRELHDGSQLRTNRELNDGSQLRTNRELNDGSQLRTSRESHDGSDLRSSRELKDASPLRSNTEVNDGSQMRTNRDLNSSLKQSNSELNDVSCSRYNKEVLEGSQLSDRSHVKSRRDSNDARVAKGSGPGESSGPVPTFKVESSNVRTGVRSTAHGLQSPLGGVKANIVYSPRPFVSDKSPAVVKDDEKNNDMGRTFGKTPSSVRDRIHKLEKETGGTVSSPSGSGNTVTMDSPSSSEPIRTSSPKHSAGHLSSNSSWKTQENLCSSTHNLNSSSQKILDSWEEDKQKKKFSYASSNSDRKCSAGDISAHPSSQQRHKDQSSAISNKPQRLPENVGGQRASSQSNNQRYSEQSRAQNLRSDLDSSLSSNDSGIDRTQDRDTHNVKGQRSFNNTTNQRLHDCSIKHSMVDHSQRDVSSHMQRTQDSYGIQGSQDNFSNRPDVQCNQTSSEYNRNQRDLDNVGIQQRQGQVVDDNNKAQSNGKSSPEQNNQSLTVQNVSQVSVCNSSCHGRQPSQEEIECDLQAQELAKELEEKDKKLSEKLRQDPKRMQYMDGIFTTIDVDRKPPGVKRSPNGTNHLSERKPSPETNTRSALPATYFKSPPKALVEMEIRMNEDGNKDLIGDIQDNDGLKKQKEELMEKLYVKLDILKEEKMALEEEITENEALGKRVKQMVEERCRTEHEKQKFFSYIDDLEKIVRLLLNLAGQLARAENAIQSLPENADPKIKKMTADKKERLNSKQEDAKRLKEDIDDRSDQVSLFLKESLLPDQFEDYCYYIKMKSKLTIDFQELEDRLTLGDEQIQELRKSIPDK